MTKAWGEDDVGDADMGLGLVDRAQRGQAQAVVGGGDGDLGPVVFAQHLGDRQIGVDRGGAELLAVARLRVLVLEEAMQEGGVRRVHADLERLQPVAFPQALEGEGVGVRRHETVERGEGGRLALADIGEDHAGADLDRIGALVHALAQLAADRLGRGLEALAVDVEEPAVERTAQSAVLQAAEGEVGVAVRTIAVEKAVTALFVAEEDEVLTQQAHGRTGRGPSNSSTSATGCQ